MPTIDNSRTARLNSAAADALRDGDIRRQSSTCMRSTSGDVSAESNALSIGSGCDMVSMIPDITSPLAASRFSGDV